MWRMSCETPVMFHSLAQAPGAAEASSISEQLERALFVLVVVVSAVVLSRLLRIVIGAVLKLLARRSRQGKTKVWLARMPRPSGETTAVALLRRDQRVHAASLMLSRIFSVTVWLIALFVILAGLEVDVAWAVSSAGFLGVALAIGGQHSVHDYVNGLHILLEDRFGEGDMIEVTTPTGETRTGTVERLGSFSTRLRGERSTWHIANRALSDVTNLSQTSSSIDVAVTLANPVVAADVQQAITQSLRESGIAGDATAKVVVDTVDAVAGSGEDMHNYRIRATTAVALNTAEHQHLGRDVADRLDR